MDRKTFNKMLGFSFLMPEVGYSKVIENHKKVKNVVLINNSYGFRKEQFVPKNDHLDSEYLNIFGDLKNDMTLFLNTEQSEMGSGHPSHHAVFTAQSKYRPSPLGGELISLDQLIVRSFEQETRLPYINLCLGDTAKTSWKKGIPVPFIETAQDAYYKVFKEEIDPSKYEEDKNLFKGMYQSSAHQRYKEAFMDLEKYYENKIYWSKSSLPDFDKKYDYHNIQFQNLDIYLDIILNGIKYKQSKVFHLNIHQNKTGVEDVNFAYHTLTHHGKDKQKIDELILVEQFQIKAFTKFLNNLKKEKLFNDTLVLVVGGFGESGSHSTKDLPCFMFGGGLKHPGLVQCKKNGELEHNLASIYLTAMHQLGLTNVSSFAGFSNSVDQYFV